MKTNSFDNINEMKNIDDISIEDMEVSYDETNEANPELGADVEMVMQETTVFSTEELSAVLEKNQEMIDVDATRVISVPTPEEIKAFEEEKQLTFDLGEAREETDDIDSITIEEPFIDNELNFEDFAPEDDENETEAEFEESGETEEEFDEEDIEESDMEFDEEDEESEEELEGESEEEVEDDDDDDEDDDEIDLEDDIIVDGEENIKPLPKKKTKNNTNKKQKNNKLKEIIGNMGALEYAGALVALVIMALLIVLGIKVIGNNQRDNIDDNQIASIGAILENIDGIGNDGIQAIGERASIDSVSHPEDTQEEVTDDTKEEEKEEEEEEVELAQISVNFSSIEKDLKIKFTDKTTGKLFTGVKFEVKATGPNSKSYDWLDTDMDGVIYVDKLDPGNYDVKIISTDKYRFPDTTTRVKVQDSVVYQVINVIDEAANMNDVDLSKEEYTGKTGQEEVSADTVEWVATGTSKSETPVGYLAITKDKISAPVASNTKKANGYMKVDGEDTTPATVSSITVTGSAQININETTQLSAVVVMQPEGSAAPQVSWSSSNTAVATVNETGVVTGVGAGSADIIATASDGSGVNGRITVQVIDNTRVLRLTVKDMQGNPIADSFELPVGATYQLTPVVEGYVADGGVTYTSSVPSSATVSEQGLITAVAKDSSTDITVATKEVDANGNHITRVIRVNVVSNPHADNVTALKTSDGQQVFIKDASGKYVEAKAADYYTAGEFFVADYTIYTGWQTIDGKVYFYDKNGKYVTGEQIIQGIKYNFASDGSLMNNNSGTMGIDVSVYQGSIDWNAVKNSGVSFVIIRCGFRGYGTGRLVKDSNFYSYIKGANDAGLKVGVYVFSQAVTEAEAVEEASLCVNMVQGYKVSYPIFIDVEEVPKGGRANSLSKDQRTAICKAFCETIKSAGYTPGVYANKDYLNNKLNARELEGYKIWLAHYCAATDYTGKYDLWQRSKKGSVNGIKGDVDLDVSFLGY